MLKYQIFTSLILNNIHIYQLQKTDANIYIGYLNDFNINIGLIFNFYIIYK